MVLLDRFYEFSYWVDSHTLECWFILYGLILFAMFSIGRLVGAPKVGFIIGVATMNSVSMVWATGFAGGQPVWITATIFIVSAVVVLLSIRNDHAAVHKTDEKEEV